jgi:cytochrome c553
MEALDPRRRGRAGAEDARHMQAGTRGGPGTALMKPVVEKLTNEDYVAIAAYVSNLK